MFNFKVHFSTSVAFALRVWAALWLYFFVTKWWHGVTPSVWRILWALVLLTFVFVHPVRTATEEERN